MRLIIFRFKEYGDFVMLKAGFSVNKLVARFYGDGETDF